MPSCSFRQLNKFKAQQLLIYLHSCQLNIFRWEIFTYKVFINSMFFFLLQAIVITDIPVVQLAFWIFSYFPLVFKKLTHFCDSLRMYSVTQIVFEFLNCFYVFGHSIFKCHLGVAGIIEKKSELLSFLHELFYHWDIFLCRTIALSKVKLFATCFKRQEFHGWPVLTFIKFDISEIGLTGYYSKFLYLLFWNSLKLIQMEFYFGLVFVDIRLTLLLKLRYFAF